jgi:predicted alpha/beta hydrolase family esterase
VKIILLPGLGKENKEWVREVAMLLRPIADSIQVHHYGHWYNEREFNWKEELNTLIRATEKENKFMIIGKSTGAALALKAIREHGIKPEACVFVSVPMKWATSQGLPLEQWLADQSVRSLFIHNKKDPSFSYKDLEKLARHKGHSVISLSGKANSYPALEIAEHIEEFIKQKS